MPERTATRPPYSASRRDDRLVAEVVLCEAEVTAHVTRIIKDSDRAAQRGVA